MKIRVLCCRLSARPAAGSSRRTTANSKYSRPRRYPLSAYKTKGMSGIRTIVISRIGTIRIKTRRFRTIVTPAKSRGVGHHLHDRLLPSVRQIREMTPLDRAGDFLQHEGNDQARQRREYEQSDHERGAAAQKRHALVQPFDAEQRCAAQRPADGHHQRDKDHRAEQDSANDDASNAGIAQLLDRQK